MKAQIQTLQRIPLKKNKPIPKSSVSGILNQEIQLGPVFRIRDKIRFYQLLASLTHAGLSLDTAIDLLHAQFRNQKIRNMALQIREDLLSGISLAECMEKQATYFSRLEIISIRMGEESGRIIQAFQNIGDYYEKKHKLESSIKQSLSYPIAVVCVATLVLGFMIHFVIPMFEDIFLQFEGELPALTRWVLWFSDLATSLFPWMFCSILFLSGLYVKFRKARKIQMWQDKILHFIPIAGKIIHKIRLARTARSLGSLLESGLNLPEALQMSSESLPHGKLSIALQQVRKDITDGQSISESVNRQEVFPPFFYQMIRVGDQGACLPEMLFKLSDQLEEDNEKVIAQFTRFLEPVLILVLGVLVALILIAMYLPMFSLSQAMSR